MGVFKVRKEIKLSFMGTGWEEAYVAFSPFTFGDNGKVLGLYQLAQKQKEMKVSEAKQASDEIISILKDKFIDGKGYDGEKLVDVTAENLQDLPMELIVHILQTLQGQALIIPKG